MSNGGSFRLLTNDGNTDRMLLATHLLNKRLVEISKRRRSMRGVKNPMPTLSDIEQTHILFVNSHFKPYVAFGYEYQRINPNSGQPRFNSRIQFSIPLYGDFFNDMVLHLKIDAVEALNSGYWDDPSGSPAHGRELIRYVNKIGQKLVTRVEFEVNSNPLDYYDSHVQNFHEKLFVTPNKQHGWYKMIAQETEMSGYKEVPSASGRVGRGAGIRSTTSLVDGPQTAKPFHEAIDVWVPLLFWFCQDPRQSIASVCIPYGQRYINVYLASARDILQHVHAFDRSLDNPGNNAPPVPEITLAELYINNIFVNPEIHDIYIKRIGFSLVRVHRIQTSQLNKVNDQVLMNIFKWPIETIYLGFRPDENYDTNSSKMLEDWDQYAHIIDEEVPECGIKDYAPVRNEFVAAGTNLTLEEIDDGLGYLAGPREDFTYLTAGGRVVPGLENFFGATIDPTDELDATVTFTANGQTLRGLDILNYYLQANGFNTIDTGLAADPNVVLAAELNSTWPEPGRGSAGQCTARYKRCEPVIDTLGVEVHAIEVYKQYDEELYNSYIPWKYGQNRINTPKDCGLYMIPFNLYPGTFQPNGHLNTSRAREFYIRYTSTKIGQELPSVQMVAVGIALNFLLISDGTAILRYST